MKNILFKNIVVVVLILTMIVPSFALGISAGGKEITIGEVNRLVGTAALIADYSFNVPAAGLLYGDFVIRFVPDGNGQKMITKSFNINGEEMLYYLINEDELVGGSLEAMKSLAGTVYTSDIASSMTDKATYGNNSEKRYPLFQRDEEGNLYIVSLSTQMLYSLTVMNRNSDTAEGKFNSDSVITKIVESTDTDAVVWVGYNINDSVVKYWVECKLVNTSGGWRIADCDFVDVLQNSRDRKLVEDVVFERTEGWDYNAPNTADASFEQIVMLTVVATLSLVAVPLTLSRKRRAM